MCGYLRWFLVCRARSAGRRVTAYSNTTTHSILTADTASSTQVSLPYDPASIDGQLTDHCPYTDWHVSPNTADTNSISTQAIGHSATHTPRHASYQHSTNHTPHATHLPRMHANTSTQLPTPPSDKPHKEWSFDVDSGV